MAEQEPETAKSPQPDGEKESTAPPAEPAADAPNAAPGGVDNGPAASQTIAEVRRDEPPGAPVEEPARDVPGGRDGGAVPSVPGGLPSSHGEHPRGHGRRRRRGRGGRGGGGEGPRPPQAAPQHAHGRSRVRAEERARQDEDSVSHVSGGAESRARPRVKREIISNTSVDETRVAILEDGRLAELHWERQNAQSIVGNIYKGEVENVLPGISSAFVNIGFEKNAYLYISDVLGQRGAPIDATLKKGQHIMVQVAKEAIGTKGMKVTMDVGLPGRYLVLTPFQKTAGSRDLGVSRNIEDPQERRRLSAIIDKLSAEGLTGCGIVARTEAEGASADDLDREARFLMAAWKGVQGRFESEPPPALIYKDLDLNLQVARDLLGDEVYVYLVDDSAAFKSVQDFASRISPGLAARVRLYDGRTPIFSAFGIEEEIQKLRQTKVTLPNGGSIIIQEAESLCAIDVNTGRFTGSKSQEETVTQTNLEAAREVAHQLRLRNIGGIVVVDFIDMRRAANRNRVMEALIEATAGDRAKIRILPITRLGLIEMTRERKKESTLSLITEECPECKGGGRVLSGETMHIRIQRQIQEMTAGRPGGQVRLLLHPGLAEYFRVERVRLEKNVHRSVTIQPDPQLQWEDYRIVLE